MIDAQKYLPFTAEFFRLPDTPASVDALGDRDDDYVSISTDVPVNLQGAKTQSDQRTEVALDEGLFTLWVHPDFAPQRYDRALINDEAYQVEGLVVPWYDAAGLLHHYECTVIDLR